MTSLFLPFSLFLVLCSFSLSALPAFPGAQGWGANSRGGRSGAVISGRTYDSRVIHVTTLAASGTGSLAAALSVGGPRYVVFDVSGTINLNQSNIMMSGYVTVAGQTSPGGITIIHGGLFARPTNTTNIFQPNWQVNEHIIMRHVRSRSSRWNGGDDNLRLEYCRDVIIDHSSFMNCCDEIVDNMYSANMTFSWCVFAESNVTCGGEVHRHAMLAVPSNGTQSLISNLWAHHDSRVPKIGSCWPPGSCYPVIGPFEIINNVLYNCDPSQTFEYLSSPVNIIGNYAKSGPDYTFTSGNPAVFTGSGGSGIVVFAEGNFNPALPSLSQQSFVSSSATWSSTAGTPVNTPNYTNGQQAALDVAARVGPFPRDSADARIVREFQTGTGQWRNVTSQEITLGQLIPRDPLTLPKWTRPADTDRDGMPDAWETAHGLNPSDSTDFHTAMNGGYDAIEVYINELSDTLVQAGRWPSTWIEKNPAPIALEGLIQVSPNPVHSGARIRFSLPRALGVEVSVYEAGGKRVETLFSGSKAAGDHGVFWDGRQAGGRIAPSGTYFLRMRSGGKEAVKKIALIR